jgi:hypothetical protein
MVDGCTVTAADTPENQAEYPQNPAQEEGLGFPIIRCVTLISLATGLLVDAETGPSPPASSPAAPPKAIPRD